MTVTFFVLLISWLLKSLHVSTSLASLQNIRSNSTSRQGTSQEPNSRPCGFAEEAQWCFATHSPITWDQECSRLWRELQACNFLSCSRKINMINAFQSAVGRCGTHGDCCPWTLLFAGKWNILLWYKGQGGPGAAKLRNLPSRSPFNKQILVDY